MVAVVVGVFAVAGLTRRPAARAPGLVPTAARIAACTLLLMGVGSHAVAARLGTSAAAAIRDLRIPHLSARDADLMRRGYYENLTAANPLNSALWDVYARRPARSEWPNVHQVGVARLTNDILHWELLPLRGAEYHGALLRTKRWGMRDHDYELVPPPGTYRIALVGPSYVMGDGVGDTETFEALLEARLERGRQPGEPAVEILNFATPNYFPLRHLVLLHRKVFAFQPDAVFMVSHVSDAQDFAPVLATAATRNYEIPFAFLREKLAALGIDGNVTLEEAARRLSPHKDDLLAQTYQQIVRDCLDRGILPVWLYIPAPNNATDDPRVAPLREMAQRAGFVTVDLGDVYQGVDPRSLWIADWDYHPNADGHRLIADRLYERLLARRDQLPLPGSAEPRVRSGRPGDSVTPPPARIQANPADTNTESSRLK
jgi:hypothetical protein